MADLIGGSLSEIEQLGAISQQVGADTGSVFADVRGKTDLFNGDIEEMTQRLEGDFQAFTDRVASEANRLASEASATNWAGLSGDAKRERLGEIHANSQTFAEQAMGNVQSFRSSLQTLVSEYYEHIGEEMGAVIEQMQEVHTAEADHAARFAAAARELDATAAAG